MSTAEFHREQAVEHFDQAKELLALATVAAEAQDTALANEYVERSNYHYDLYEQERTDLIAAIEAETLEQAEEERTAGMMLVLLAIPLLIYFVVLVA